MKDEAAPVHPLQDERDFGGKDPALVNLLRTAENQAAAFSKS